MGDIGRCELIYGELVMMSPAGPLHGAVAMRIGRLIAEYVEANDLGEVFAAETGFKVETNPDLVRAPDAAFIRKSRLAEGYPKGFFTGAPDLAVEVMSPGDSRRAVAEKVNMWLANGAISCWVANPSLKVIDIHRTGETTERCDLELRDEKILPGFVMPLAKVFK